MIHQQLYKVQLKDQTWYQTFCHWYCSRPHLIYQYSTCNMVLRLSGPTSMLGINWFVSKSLLGIEWHNKHKRFKILTRNAWCHVRILNFWMWPIDILFSHVWHLLWLLLYVIVIEFGCHIILIILLWWADVV